MLSTIILNWNRSYLLKRTVESYLDTTVGADVELVIVDNASSDDSREYLEALASKASIKILLLEENKGGTAYNEAIPSCRGQFIQLSENDQEYLPGWLEHVLEAFEKFEELGQLSLFGTVPTDQEAAGLKPARLRFSKGKILYEAHGNVGTSSIIRGELFREHGVKVTNIEQGPFKFPNDGQLSADIKNAGYWAGFSDRYYVRNVGHEVTEFEANPEYYQTNYASKPWIGVKGWRARIAAQQRLQSVQRRSMVFPHLPLSGEKTPHPVLGKPAQLWSMFDGYTAEVEVLDFLFALVRLVKPEHIIETGTWIGLSASAMAMALEANGFGRLTTLEVNPEAFEKAAQTFKEHAVESRVQAHLVSSLDYVPEGKFDFAIFDSELELREKEFHRFRPWLTDGAIVVFHDTAKHHGVVGDCVAALTSSGALKGIDFPTPRGIFVGTLLPQS
jgi:Glycosyl transferase family 2/Methyltransferase domain